MKKRFLPFVNRRYISTVGDAGDFTASEHLEFLLKAEEKWADGDYRADLQPHAEAAIMLLKNQTARFEELGDPDKDNQVKATWLKTCGIVVDDFDRTTDSCDIDGDELETASETYDYDILKKVSFKIDVEKTRTNIYSKEDQIPDGFNRMDKQLSEYYALVLMQRLSGFAGDNVAAINNKVLPMTYDAGTNTTNIPAGSYNTSIVAALLKTMMLNQVQNGMFLDDGELWIPWKNAMLNGGNLDGAGDDLRTKQFPIDFDMWNFAAANISENLFLLDKNAVAMRTYNRFGDTPEKFTGNINQTRYRMKSNILPGVYWDVRYMMKCIGGKDFHIWQAETEGGIWLNPTRCPIVIGETEYQQTGVWGFTKTA